MCTDAQEMTCVCMYVCMYVCGPVYLRFDISLVCVRRCMYVCMYVCMYGSDAQGMERMYACTYECMCARAYVIMRDRSTLCMYTYVHAYMHLYERKCGCLSQG